MLTTCSGSPIHASPFPLPILPHPKRREPHRVTTQRTQTRRDLPEVQHAQTERKAKMAATNSRVFFDVHFISFHDDNLPGTAITDSKAPTSFVLTTGGFPQEVIVQTRAASAKISKLSVALNDAKDILVEKCCGETPTAFEVMAERTLARGSVGGSSSNPSAAAAAADGGVGGPQTETFDLDPEGAGRDIRFIRLTILSGYSEFVAVYSIDAWGEESQQRVAVLQSKPEVVM
ncbi:hypothetical protein, conserved [Leishmania donovani]|uniref:PITH domain-containing protein n=1 Tax=Leishmania donovani TaxID=5661 RepID=E9BA05_LEIDO|nr:hypothetical protein, conserved [Leishmania donovani]AYU76561.1 hypothetical protein LdCL_090018400 [Leishmania donovani]CBZ32078.1 hypothetical protein, conserved [Leishmania donovani]